MGNEKRISRRQLLRDAAGAVTLASMGGVSACFPDVGGEWSATLDPLCTEAAGDSGVDARENQKSEGGQDATAEGKDALVEGSKVVEVYREDSVANLADGRAGGIEEIQAHVVQEMVDQALSELAGGVENPWPVLLPDYVPGMRIGLKVNGLNPGLPTSPAMVRAIVTSLRTKLGVDPATILVWDRYLSDLTRQRGYTQEGLGGAELVGTLTSTKDTTGPGYTEAVCGVVDGQAPKLSRILTELTDVTINCPVLKTHGVSGVTAALKNIYGIIHNPGSYHGNLQTALPLLYKLPPIRKHLRLVVADALVSVINGDTIDPPNGTPRRILAARDPLALDSYALELMDQLRKEGGFKTNVDRETTKWLDNAAPLGLGNRVFKLTRVPPV